MISIFQKTSLECWRPLLSNDVSHNGVHPVLELKQLSSDIMYSFYLKIVIDNLTVITWIVRVKMPITMWMYHNATHSWEWWGPQVSINVSHNGVHMLLKLCVSPFNIIW